MINLMTKFNFVPDKVLTIFNIMNRGLIWKGFDNFFHKLDTLFCICQNFEPCRIFPMLWGGKTIKCAILLWAKISL